MSFLVLRERISIRVHYFEMAPSLIKKMLDKANLLGMFQDVPSEALSPYIIYFKMMFQLPFSQTTVLSPPHFNCYDKEHLQLCTICMATLEKTQWFWAKRRMPGALLFSHSFPHWHWSPCWRRAERRSGCQQSWFLIFVFDGVLLWLVGCFYLVVGFFPFSFSKNLLPFSCLPVTSLAYEICFVMIRLAQLRADIEEARILRTKMPNDCVVLTCIPHKANCTT